MRDLLPHLPERDKILHDADQKVRHLYSKKEGPHTQEEAVAIIQDADNKIVELLKNNQAVSDNRFGTIALLFLPVLGKGRMHLTRAAKTVRWGPKTTRSLYSYGDCTVTVCPNNIPC